jgi:uncharacterized glyoxalase superfamily protein PhnB
MSNGSREDRPNVFPALKYKDAPGAVAWLERAFGFEKALVVPNPDGTIAHAELKIGPGHVMCGSKREPQGDKNPWDDATAGVYVYVADVDAHYARARSAGAEIVRDLADTDYGSREYSARDPEGNLWSFGTYLPGDH